MTLWKDLSDIPRQTWGTEKRELVGELLVSHGELTQESGEVVTENGDSWADFKEVVRDELVNNAGLVQSAKKQTLGHQKHHSNDDHCTCEMESGDCWKNFNEISLSLSGTKKHQGEVEHIFKACFPVATSSYCNWTSTDCIFCCHRFLYRQQPQPMDTTPLEHISIIFNGLILSHSKENSPNSRVKSHLYLDLPAECNNFDWNVEKEQIELSDMSPIVFKPMQPDSPIGLDFDQGRAVMGLGVLSEDELKKMIKEMEIKFAHRSEVLINDLVVRDKLVYELSVKNKFISALLQVQALRHSYSLPNNTGRLESVGRAFASKTKSVEDKSNTHFLTLVIPYNPPENYQWKLTVLRNITDILNAIAEGSESVPKLLAEYIQGEVLQIESKER